MDEMTRTTPPVPFRSGWGKPTGARTWHFFTTFAPSDAWPILTSLCGKWDAGIDRSGKPSLMLWPGLPPSFSIYRQCQECVARKAIGND